MAFDYDTEMAGNLAAYRSEIQGINSEYSRTAGNINKFDNTFSGRGGLSLTLRSLQALNIANEKQLKPLLMMASAVGVIAGMAEIYNVARGLVKTSIAAQSAAAAGETAAHVAAQDYVGVARAAIAATAVGASFAGGYVYGKSVNKTVSGNDYETSAGMRDYQHTVRGSV